MTRILRLISGSDTVDLMDKSKYVVQLYSPKAARYKEGGLFQDSPDHDGRVLSHREFANVSEIIRLSIVGSSPDNMEQNLADLLNIIEKSANYWTGVESDFTYFEMKPDNMTNSVKALVHSGSLEELGDAFGTGVEVGVKVDGTSVESGFVDLTLGIERGHWAGNIPGAGTAVQVSNTQEWFYDDQWEILQNDAITGSASAVPFNLVESPTTGTLYAIVGGTSPRIIRSADEGLTWTTTYTFTAGVSRNAFLAPPLSNGYIVGVDLRDSGDTVRSENDGSSWTSVGSIGDDNTANLYTLANDSILATDPSIAGTVRISSDEGDTWSFLTQDLGRYVTQGILEAANSDLYITSYATSTAPGEIWRSTDVGISWDRVFVSPLVAPAVGAGITNIIQLSSGRILATFFGQRLTASDDNGTTWNQLVDFADFSQSLQATQEGIIFQSDDGTVFALYEAASLTETVVFVSTDNAESWAVEQLITFTHPGNILVARLVESSVGIIAGGEEMIFGRTTQSSETMGQSATIDNIVFVANKHNIANLTNILVEDNSLASFTEIFPLSGFPVDLLPDPAGDDDAVYFGFNSSIIDSGPGCSIIVNLAQDLRVGDTDLIWEYYTGTWDALDVQDNSFGFSLTGVRSIHFAQPSDWTTVSVNSITALWIRARLSVSSGSINQIPQQQTQNIYTVTQPFVDMLSAQVSGDIPSLARIKVYNQSDFNGRTSGAPNLWSNRIIVGLRSQSRGANFSSFINFSDEQEKDGTVVILGTNTTFSDDVTTATGRKVIYNPAGVEALATRAKVRFGPNLSNSFFGLFHVLLRVQRTAGNITDFDIRLQIVSGSGGINTTTFSKQVQTTTAWELLDFGQIDLPGADFNTTDIGDQTEIRVQVSAASGTPNLELYDLALIPTDEWAMDAIDQVNDGSSILGRNNNIAKIVDIDSISYPKSIKQALIRESTGDKISSLWIAGSHGPAILQPDENQRLWFLSARTNATGASPVWISEPWICHSVQVFKNERYLSLRGGR